jgi:hypothetical protein
MTRKTELWHSERENLYSKEISWTWPAVHGNGDLSLPDEPLYLSPFLQVKFNWIPYIEYTLSLRTFHHLRFLIGVCNEFISNELERLFEASFWDPVLEKDFSESYQRISNKPVLAAFCRLSILLRRARMKHFNYGGSTTCSSHDSYFFGPWPLSQDSDVKFTWELFLRLAVLHIFLYNLKRGRNNHCHLQTAIRIK